MAKWEAQDDPSVNPPSFEKVHEEQRQLQGLEPGDRGLLETEDPIKGEIPQKAEAAATTPQVRSLDDVIASWPPEFQGASVRAFAKSIYDEQIAAGKSEEEALAEVERRYQEEVGG